MIYGHHFVVMDYNITKAVDVSQPVQGVMQGYWCSCDIKAKHRDSKILMHPQEQYDRGYEDGYDDAKEDLER